MSVRNDIKLLLYTSFTIYSVPHEENIPLLWQYHCTHNCTLTRANVCNDIKIGTNCSQHAQQQSSDADVHNLHIKHPTAIQRLTALGYISCHLLANVRLRCFSWTDSLSFWLYQTPLLAIALLSDPMTLKDVRNDYKLLGLYKQATRAQGAPACVTTCNPQTHPCHFICFLAFYQEFLMTTNYNQRPEQCTSSSPHPIPFNIISLILCLASCESQHCLTAMKSKLTNRSPLYSARSNIVAWPQPVTTPISDAAFYSALLDIYLSITCSYHYFETRKLSKGRMQSSIVSDGVKNFKAHPHYDYSSLILSAFGVYRFHSQQ